MLEIKNLKIKIKGKNEDNVKPSFILENVNFIMETGKVYVLDGRNGSGKSSLLSAIMGHPNYEIVEGEIIIKNNNEENINSNERDVKNYENKSNDESSLIKNNSVEESAAAGIYMTMQMVPEIEGVTLIQLLHKAINKKQNNLIKVDNKKDENLSKYESSTGQKKNEINILELNKKLIKYCEDFDIDKSFISRDLNYKMSGGEKKQAELLHLLTLKPKYILIDEIDSGVDRESIEKIYKVLKYLQEENNSSLLIVSHHTNVSDYLEVERTYTLENKTIV